jgi:hypothetical protein
MPIVPAREAIVGATTSHMELTTFTPISLAGLAPLYLGKRKIIGIE